MQKTKPTSTVTLLMINNNVLDLTNGFNSQTATNSEAAMNPLCSDTIDVIQEEVATNDDHLQVLKKCSRSKGSTAENKWSKTRNLHQALNYAPSRLSV